MTINKPKKDPTKTRAITVKKRKSRIKKDLLEELRKNPIIATACLRSGINPSTFYRWTQEDRKFAAEVRDACKEGTLLISDMAQSRVIQGIKDGVPTYVLFWLKTRSKEFVEKVTHNHNHAIQVNDQAGLLTNERLEKIKDMMIAWRDPNLNKQVKIEKTLKNKNPDDNTKKSNDDKNEENSKPDRKLDGHETAT
ncbi:MAG: hypothetical protein WC465_03270 [Patescibacteria group bacterium]|jgi:hypothetical protein